MSDYNSKPIRPDLLYLAISSAVLKPSQGIKPSELGEWADRCKQVRNIPQSDWPQGFANDLGKVERYVVTIRRANDKLKRLMSSLGELSSIRLARQLALDEIYA